MFPLSIADYLVMTGQEPLAIVRNLSEALKAAGANDVTVKGLEIKFDGNPLVWGLNPLRTISSGVIHAAEADGQVLVTYNLSLRGAAIISTVASLGFSSAIAILDPNSTAAGTAIRAAVLWLVFVGGSYLNVALRFEDVITPSIGTTGPNKV